MVQFLCRTQIILKYYLYHTHNKWIKHLSLATVYFHIITVCWFEHDHSLVFWRIQQLVTVSRAGESSHLFSGFLSLIVELAALVCKAHLPKKKIFFLWIDNTALYLKAYKLKQRYLQQATLTVNNIYSVIWKIPKNEK